MTPTDDPALERLAHQRAGRKLGWYHHASVYLAVNGALLLLAHFLGSGHHGWTLFPAVGWGFGLAMHGLRAFAPGSEALRERLVERERRKLLDACARAPFA